MGTRFFRVLLGCQNFNNEKIIWLSWYCVLTCEVYFYLHFTKDFSLAGKFHRTMYVNLQGYSCTYILWIQCFFMVQVKFTVLRIHRFVISGPATYDVCNISYYMNSCFINNRLTQQWNMYMHLQKLVFHYCVYTSTWITKVCTSIF